MASMKMPKHEFMELQRQWYRKLAEQGFKDIEVMEQGDMRLCAASNVCFRYFDTYSMKFVEDYFRCMFQMVNDETTVFANDIDRYILFRYCDGISQKQIVAELKDKGTPRCRRSIRVIIRRYEMAWGIKNYNRKQLNLKKSA